MSGGKILQIGTPEEIYERPSARFVADFIGETNLLEATRIGERRFRLASGAEIEAAEPGPAGNAVTLAVRPERANLAPPGGAGLAGIVEQVVYEGTDTTYYVLLAGGLRFRLSEQNRDGARPRVGAGDAIAVTLPAAAIRVLVE
jgi:spermidine/putrescine transport system ATP-binding protein